MRSYWGGKQNILNIVMIGLSKELPEWDETRAEIILKMYKKGYSLEQIADVTDKSIAEIEKIVEKEPVRI